ncbi:hypothetical protein [Microbulbifer sp. THAF38]|uniref:hypothetical protein n=1 Tax=Microbulbifer sp. THAF38 TaxID=2587856 RepID=UPI00126880FA|nr:hypothetical protein [Microbulbifer sp. THAF38]QFT57111.1 hypothetical protein FIU95_21400 [Microbulbifer sp. THAF38]
MDNRIMFREISRLRTTDLLIAKMDCIRRIALFKSLKLGLLGLLGIFVGQVAKSLFAAQAMSMMDYLSVALALYCVIGYLILDALEAGSTAQEKLICDLLTLRMSRTGKRKS